MATIPLMFPFIKNGRTEDLNTFVDGVPVQKLNDVPEKQSKDIILTESTHGITVRAARKFKKGEKLYHFPGQRYTSPTMYTVQIDDKIHVLVEGGPEYTCHSCSPTARFDMEHYADPTLIAVRDIEVGEEITFHYCTTEWSMAAPFQCDCKVPTCMGKIQGYKHMTAAQRATMPREWLSPCVTRHAKEENLL